MVFRPKQNKNQNQRNAFQTLFDQENRFIIGHSRLKNKSYSNQKHNNNEQLFRIIKKSKKQKPSKQFNFFRNRLKHSCNIRAL